MSANNAKNDADNKGYWVISLSDGESDWTKIILINRLLAFDWDVYRNTALFNRYPAGSFFIPSGGLPVNRERAGAYLEEKAQELGISPVFHEEALPAEGLKKLLRPRVALFYATGQKWSVMTLKALEKMGFEVDALSAEDIRRGALDHANVLFIPGGSHTDKATEVGPDGEAKVKEFAERGGGVLGFCGGSALIAQVKEGWGLLAVERHPGKVPSAMHGPIWIKPETSDHPMWYGYSSGGVAMAPWFGLALQPISDEVRVLGRYDRPTDDFYIDYHLNGNYFSQYLPEEMETLEACNGYANPAILKGLAAIVEGEYGAGKIIIGYPHPETPGLEEGFLLLANAIYHVAASPPIENSPWLPSAGEKSYGKPEVLSLLESVKEIHSSLVLPAAKDLVSFGVSNLYWSPRPHIPWCYISKVGYPFYVCERLDAYGDEISRQLDEIPHLISEINAKRESLLALAEQPRIKDGLKQVTERIDAVYNLSGKALSQTQETYRSRLEASLADWVTNYKRILLYRQLLAMMKAKDTDAAMISDVTRKDKALTGEYLGSWKWAEASEKYRDIFITLDNASYYLSNLKFELLDISLKLDCLLLTGSE